MADRTMEFNLSEICWICKIAENARWAGSEVQMNW